MSKVFIEETTLSNIGSAIREKTGKSNLISPINMPNEIKSIVSGGGGDIEVEPIVLSGNTDYAFASALAQKYVELYGDTITTNWMSTASHLFYRSKLTGIPFELNFNTSNQTFDYAFGYAVDMELPKMNNARPNNISYLFGYSEMKKIPSSFNEDIDWYHLHTNAYDSMNNVFYSCNYLREIDEGFLSNMWGIHTSSYSSPYKDTFARCYNLDKINRLGVHQATLTSNFLNGMISECSSLCEFTFDTNDDGSPKTANWKSQTLSIGGTLTMCVNNQPHVFTSYGRGKDKEVKDAETYEALKNDPDYWTTKEEWARYNHDSAVRTINSLPDTSAYLATAGGTNTIKFKGKLGMYTDGGAVNTLTAEEIAVATAKGWTVSLI